MNKNYYESHINPKPVDEKKKSLSSSTAATADAATIPSSSPSATPLVASIKTTTASTTPSTATATPTSASTTAPEHAEKKEASEATNQDQNVTINTKPKKAKFQKNVGKGKVSKANAFQIQQKLVKEEAKAPVVSTVRTDTSTIAVTRSASSCASDNSDSACCQSNEVHTVLHVLYVLCVMYSLCIVTRPTSIKTDPSLSRSPLLSSLLSRLPSPL